MPFENFFSEEHQKVFIHIPKTGGTSIRKYLFGSDNGGHVRLIDLPKEYHNYDSFAFVRNPYSRVLSVYNFLKNGAKDTSHSIITSTRNYSTVIKSFSSFEDFVCRGLEAYYLDIEHFLPQYLYTHFLGVKLVKTICKYENYDDEVFKLFGVKLDVMNETADYEKDISKNYNENTYQVVNRLYKEDFALFGYPLAMTATNILRDYFYSCDFNHLKEIFDQKLHNKDERIFNVAIRLGLKENIISLLKYSEHNHENYYKLINLGNNITEEDYVKHKDHKYFYMRSENKDLTGVVNYVPKDYQMFFEALELKEEKQILNKLNEIILFLEENNYRDDFNYFVLNPFYYYLCYRNFNIIEIQKTISKICRIKNPIYNRINTPNLEMKKIDKIKIVFFAGRVREISSVFFDRSQTIMNLPNDVYEKYLFVVGGLDKNSMLNPAYHSFVSCFKEMYDADIVGGIDFIFEKNFDIIVFPDIGMLSPTVLYAHLRSAPLQITTWGHSKTSGIDTIDYYFSSELYEIENAQDHYSEKLIKFKGMGTTYPVKVWDKNAFFKIKELEGKFVIGCLCSIIKFDSAFVAFLKRFEKHKNIVFIVLTNKKLDGLTNVFQAPAGNMQVFFNYIYNCNIMVDTYPFGSCNLGLECYLMGKIMLYYPSEFLSGRYVKGFYKVMGIKGDIVESNSFDEYYENIMKISVNRRLRKRIEKKIRENRDLLFNEKLNLKEWNDNLTELLLKTGTREFSDELKENIKKYNPFDIKNLGEKNFDPKIIL